MAIKFDPEARLAARPTIEYDEQLPVNQRREELAQAIARHQVVVVCGETGSGKTTQLPKICLQLGRGSHGLIGHTQPRRIAARATAARIAQELKSELGQHVGYKIRFTDRTSPASYIKLMTDGILLAETQGDPLLRQYDTLIIDEAHERSLNIDFLLGYLKQLLPRRPDLKVIITSATLDAAQFSRHFNDAPVIEVSGRLYPIEIRWRPVQGADGHLKERDLNEAIVDAVDELQRLGTGDVLIFLPGEREIREAAEALRKQGSHSLRPGLMRTAREILPLFARQSAQEQSRIFAPRKGQGMRVVLATNVAETSLTVPGIRYVVDTGLARIKRYSHRNKVEQLQVEPISQAAARQRAGRCGRVSQGVCIRLYDEADFLQRPEHTDPEILRSSLAGVILRMKSLRLGEVADFPFLQPPLPKMISDGYQLLSELGAVDDQHGRRLTQTGQQLARLPLDPKIGRMILAGRALGALTEVLVIAAALSIPDPRERPQERAAAADQAHARWQDERSEFLSWLKLWQASDEIWQHESSSKQKIWCKQNFISWLRLREWRDIHGQLRTLCAEQGWRDNVQPASYEALHCALLTGLLGNIGLKSEDAGHYLGAHGIKFFIHPGSTLVKKAGRWIVAAELVETSRLFARCIARIEPQWLERVGGHLLRKHLDAPHWEKNSGQVVAFERGTLHGLLLYAKRRVSFGRPPSEADKKTGSTQVSAADIKLARELFIRDGLVAGEMPEDFIRRAKFFQHNRKLVRDIEKLEHKSRRPDVLVDETLIAAFYDSLLPEDITTLAAFDAWRKQVEAHTPQQLFLQREQLMRHEAAGITTEAFPAHLLCHGRPLKLSYHHDPGAADDGVTLSIPLAQLNQIPATRCEWLVPGLLEEKVTALLKTLPQKYRHRLQPLADFAAAFREQDHALDEPLLRALTRAVEEKLAMKLPLDAFRPGELRSHLLMNFRLLDEHGATLALSRSLSELRGQFAARVEQSFAQAQATAVGSALQAAAKHSGKNLDASASPTKSQTQNKSVAKTSDRSDRPQLHHADHLTGLTSWSFGELPELMEVLVNGRKLLGFPGLVDEGDSVALRVFDTPEKAQAEHQQGLSRLFMLNAREQLKQLEKTLFGGTAFRDLALQCMSWLDADALRSQILAVALERSFLAAPWPTQAEAFDTRLKEGKPRLTLIAQEVLRLLGSIVQEHVSLQKKLAPLAKACPAVVADIQAQCNALLHPGFIRATAYERLQQYPRYLKGAVLRLEKMRKNPTRDEQQMSDWQQLAKPWERERLIQLKAGGAADGFFEEFRWLLEELRIALYAQELRTPSPVSVKRLQKMWEGRPR
ncbi:MAG: ATP-dependent RNA helicase HrpA [Sterolibacterium sp.]|nr:ATP-dependent RNA helicase HrpA [Sterolibacterium sp.]